MEKNPTSTTTIQEESIETVFIHQDHKNKVTVAGYYDGDRVVTYGVSVCKRADKFSKADHYDPNQGVVKAIGRAKSNRVHSGKTIVKNAEHAEAIFKTVAPEIVKEALAKVTEAIKKQEAKYQAGKELYELIEFYLEKRNGRSR